MHKFQKQLLIIKETRERLRKDEITKVEASQILSEIDIDYKHDSSNNCEESINKCFGDLLKTDKVNRSTL